MLSKTLGRGGGGRSGHDELAKAAHQKAPETYLGVKDQSCPNATVAPQNIALTGLFDARPPQKVLPPCFSSRSTPPPPPLPIPTYCVHSCVGSPFPWHACCRIGRVKYPGSQRNVRPIIPFHTKGASCSVGHLLPRPPTRATWQGNHMPPPPPPATCSHVPRASFERGGGEGGRGFGTQSFVYQKWPEHILPFVDFVFPHDGHFGLGGEVRGGGVRPPPLQEMLSC